MTKVIENSRSVTITPTLVKGRAMDLTHRQFLTLVDQVELTLIVEVLTGETGDIDITDVWLEVLKKRNHAPVSYDDPEQRWQHEPYADFRLEAHTVMLRLEDLAAGRPVAENSFERYPDTDDEAAGSRRYLDALLMRAAEMVSFTYDGGAAYDGGDLLQLLEWNAKYALKRHFAEQWFDGTYALGYAMMEQPGVGLSAVGDRNEQLAFIRSLAIIVLDATRQFEHGNLDEHARMAYGHVVAFFAPMLKAAVLWASEAIDSPLGATKPGDNLVELVGWALGSGGKAHASARNGIRLMHHRWSADGQRAQQITTDDLLSDFAQRTASETSRSNMAGL